MDAATPGKPRGQVMYPLSRAFTGDIMAQNSILERE